MRKKQKICYFLLLLAVLALTGSFGKADGKAAAASDETVYASGIPVGIYIKTEGVLVLGLQDVKQKNGQESSPAKYKIKPGDYILKVNGKTAASKKEFIRLLQDNGGKKAALTLKRDGQTIKTTVTPVYSKEEKSWQIGVWIRNDTQGIGTVTYIKSDGTFAALGHGISDSNLGKQLAISGGSVYRTVISSITKGQAGNPGEIIGSIDYIPGNYLGKVFCNTNGGILGKITKNPQEFYAGSPVKIADKSEVKKGKAYLRSSISGKSRDYSIKIEKVTINGKNSLKSLKIRVTDPELIALTGGIIQGLSGSPVLQNGKLVGAVTHVLVDDPKKGYGILAEDMENMEGLAEDMENIGD